MAESGIERRTRSWRRDNRLRQLGYKSYRAYIGSLEWRALRADYWADPHTPKDCAVCGNEARILHHRTYERVGAERFEDLAPFCDTCHSLVHALERRGDLGLDFDGLVGIAGKLRKPDPELLEQKRTLHMAETKASRGTLAAEYAARQARRVEEREAAANT